MTFVLVATLIPLARILPVSAQIAETGDPTADGTPTGATDPVQAPLLPGPDGLVTVLVQMEAPSAADVWISASKSMGIDPSAVQAPPLGADLSEPGLAAASAAYMAVAAATQAQLAGINAQQQALSSELRQLGAIELYRAQRLYNAIAIRIPAENLDAVRRLEGVLDILPLLAKEPGQARSIPFLGIPEVWQGGGGVGPLTGAGIRVGVIDTGIDYIHTTFGGSGEGYFLNDTTIVGDVPDYPGIKVVGGFDFAGDDYNANPNSISFQPTPNPDPDPADCYGHGTHVAGTISGLGVTESGATFSGPFSTATPFSSLRIGPGVAPGADLFALKVFGCEGTSDLVDLAIEWSVDPNGDGDFSDRLDVINMSLGSPLGSYLDSTSKASDKAAELGVFVVASAGNSGPISYFTGSPGTSTAALSVAAVSLPAASDIFFPGSGADQLAAFSAMGPRRGDSGLKPEVAAPGVAIVSARSGSGSAELVLSGTSMAAPHVAGAAALLLQQRPTLNAEQLKALLVNTAAPVVRSEFVFTDTTNSMVQGGGGRIDIPSAIQNDVLAWNGDDAGMVTLSYGAVDVLDTHSAVRNMRIANTGALARTFDLFYTPSSVQADLPGVEVEVVSAPTVTVAAGATANVVVAVNFDASQMQNTGLSNLGPDSNEVRLETETGWLWLWPRPSTFVAAATGSGATPPSTSPATGTLNATFDPTTSELTWSASVSGVPASAVTGLDLRRGPAGQADTDAAYLLYDRGGGPPPTFPLTGTLTLLEADLPLLAGGYLQLAVGLGPDGRAGGILRSNRPVLKVPLHVAPRPVSDMRAGLSALDYGDADFAWRALPLVGQTLGITGAPTQTVALLTPLELHLRSPQAPATQNPPTPPIADIKFVGVTSDLSTAGSVENSTISFAVSTYGPWSTPSEVVYTIHVDTSGDGVPDYRVYNAPQGFGFNDRFVAAVETVNTGVIEQGPPINGFDRSAFVVPAFNSDTMVLRVAASSLGLTQARSTVRFFVTSRLRVSDVPSVGEQTPVSTYDVRRPGITFSAPFVGAVTMIDQPGSGLITGLNRVQYSRSTAKGILLVHHHNALGARAETVNVRFSWPVNVHLPIAGRAD